MSTEEQKNDSFADEQVLLVVHKHWAAFARDAFFVFLPGLIVLAILFIVRGLSGSMVDVTVHAMVTLLLPFTFLVLWMILAVIWTTYYLDMLVVTDRRIFYASQMSLVRRATEEWRIADVRHASVAVGSMLESYFNYGTLMLQTGEESAAVFEGIPDPGYVSAVILKQDDRYGELKKTAQKQEELLHFLSHEVKGHLAKSKAAFAAIIEGDYGPVSEPVASLAHLGLADTQKGVDTVMSILDKPGSKKTEATAGFDLSAATQRIVDEFHDTAMHKGIAIRSSIEPGCFVGGDGQKIERHVIRNLVDNAFRYTPAGQVEVTLKKEGNIATLSVADTGIGIGANDMKKLFTEGGRGELSRNINPESTGYGLYFAKQIVEAQGGRIWATSSGPGTGSHFFVELPLV